MMDFHLVSSPSAAGSLHVAVRELGLPGKVFCIMDHLGLGPLTDGRARVGFWRSLAATGYQEWDPQDVERDDAFAQWRELRSCVAAGKPQRLLIWVSGSGADYVLLRMACHWLAGENVAIWRVFVPPERGFHAVAIHPPEALATFAPDAVAIPLVEVTAMAEEYGRIAARPELLRECDAQGRLLFRPITAHDDFILKCCPDEWTPAARAVGEAMGRSDPRNSLGDLFVASRLQYLISAGLVEADGPRKTLRDYRVRRRQAGTGHRTEKYMAAPEAAIQSVSEKRFSDNPMRKNKDIERRGNSIGTPGALDETSLLHHAGLITSRPFERCFSRCSFFTLSASSSLIFQATRLCVNPS